MLFNSIEFLIFLPITFLLYWNLFSKNRNSRNIFLICVSYIFYGWWDWRFLSLIIFSSFIDYNIGIKLSKTEKTTTRKYLLLASLIINIGFLVFFKYFNFFIDSFIELTSFFGIKSNPWSLKVILPVGISFYTFQTLSYTIDVYRNKIKATKDLFAFFAYVSFFPQLVAGPIERATNLLPQFYTKKNFNLEESKSGLIQILWGLFKKIVIADNAAIFVNDIFSDYSSQSSGTLILGAIFFAFQIYGDFSGYSDIAIGTAKLFGFSLMQNFSYPYFSRDIAEFWRRWHISLSTWFRDYLYIPLGGSRVNKIKQIRNTFIIFLVSGFWHGANWTFIVWGFINALYFIPLMLRNKNRKNLKSIAANKIFPSISEIFNIIKTFLLVCLAWIFFRSSSLNDAFSYIHIMLTNNPFKFSGDQITIFYWVIYLLVIIFMIMVEWIYREEAFPLEKIKISSYSKKRWAFCYILVVLIYLFGVFNEQTFIYFQF